VTTFAGWLYSSLSLQPHAQLLPFAVAINGQALPFTESSFVGSAGSSEALYSGPNGLVLRMRGEKVGAGIQLSAVLTNEGAAVEGPFTTLTTAQVRLAAQSDPGTLVSTWQGARFLANFFPPDDFAPADRLLVKTPQVLTPLAVHGGDDGRGSSEDLPFMSIESRPMGLVIAVEWSGTWMISVKQSTASDFHSVDVTAGIWGLAIELAPGRSVELATILLLPVDSGRTSPSNALRKHIREHVTPRLNGEEMLPPTSFNSWFAFENQFTDGLLRPAVLASSAAGYEYFVVDGGWYEGGFRQGIGNWDRPDHEKFSRGFEEFSSFVQTNGMKFGTWFEPEFARVGSALERQHPDWFLPGPMQSAYSTPTNWQYGLEETQYRLLDFGLPQVQEYWVDRIHSAYRDWNVRWIRWDFNQQPRPHWDLTPDSGASQIAHLTGLYRVLDQIMANHPDLVIEQCASGGHRIDLALARRGHTFWMNDHTTNSDIVRRLQTRLNTVLPGNYANTNLCQPRHDFSEYDFLSHSGGGFGFSGRLWEMPSADFDRLRAAVERYKGFRPTLLGDFHSTIDDERNPQGAELHRWSDGARSVEFEFNGRLGIGNAEVRID
jgi:alpha-galactosidase